MESSNPALNRSRVNQPETVVSSNSKLRVTIVSDAILGRNGVGTYYADLVDQLQSHVQHIRLLGPTNQPEGTCEWFSIPMPGDSTQRLAYPRPKVLSRLVLETNPNVIVVPSLGAYSYYAIRIARRHKIPFALVNHTNFDHLLELYWPAIIARPLRWILSRLMRKLIRQANGVAAMNVESLSDARAANAKLVRVMGTPLATAFLHTPQQPLLPTPRRVVFIGRLSAEKRIDEILRAAQALPDFQFEIAGDGPLRAQVERVAERLTNLTYLGWLPRGSVLQAMDRADVLVLPSDLETFGTVALEALARGRYVMVSRSCGVANWPSLSRGLFFIESGEGLAASLSRLASMPRETRDEIASRSWQAVARFNEHALRGWRSFLGDVAGLQNDDPSDSLWDSERFVDHQDAANESRRQTDWAYEN